MALARSARRAAAASLVRGERVCQHINLCYIVAHHHKKPVYNRAHRHVIGIAVLSLGLRNAFFDVSGASRALIIHQLNSARKWRKISLALKFVLVFDDFSSRPRPV